MNRKIKIVSILFATYLGVLPLFFYLHAVDHQHAFSYCESNDKISLLSTEIDEDICDLCELYVKQDISNSPLSLFEKTEAYILKEEPYLFTTSTIQKEFHLLRAPPLNV